MGEKLEIKNSLPEEIVHPEIEEKETSVEMILEEIENIIITLKIPTTGNRPSFLKRIKELAKEIPEPPIK